MAAHDDFTDQDDYGLFFDDGDEDQYENDLVRLAAILGWAMLGGAALGAIIAGVRAL